MKLQNFNAWGSVVIAGQTVTASLAAVTSEGKHIKRQITNTATHPVPTGEALIGVVITPDSYVVESFDLSGEDVAHHPEALLVLDQLTGWVRDSI